MHAACAILEPGQRTTKERHTAVDHLITPRGFVTTLYITWMLVAVRCKIVNCTLKAVKGIQYKLE
jgi:hypothetical protein